MIIVSRETSASTNAATMMKQQLLILLLSYYLSLSEASPAIVWQRSSDSAVVHNSKDVSAQKLLSTVFTTTTPDNNDYSVLFLMARGSDGTESFTPLAPKLPNIASKSNAAGSTVYHHVSGMSSAGTLIRESNLSLVEASFAEFKAKMAGQYEEISTASGNNKSQFVATKRARALAAAKSMIVTIPFGTDPADIDQVVVDAVEKFDNVILSAQRSFAEIKKEREDEYKRIQMAQLKEGQRIFEQQNGHRRLDDQGNGGNNNNNNQSTVFVSMTPNILAGLLFTFLFTFAAIIGFSCMGSIAGQDVFVSKYPTIGKEA